MREQFEKLPEITEMIKSSDVWWSEEHGNYISSTFESSCYISGAWYAFQELNKPKKIDKLQARVDEVLKVCDNLRTDLIRENHVEYDKGWKDCATSIYHQLKGIKMIDTQVQEVLDILNSQLHGRVDYSLFSQIFDEVASIGVPQGYKLVPVEPTYKQLDALKNSCVLFQRAGVSDLEANGAYKAMIGASK